MDSYTLEFKKLSTIKINKSLRDLEINKGYKILKSKRVTNSIFGVSILLELEECSVFLPKRFSGLSNDFLLELDKGAALLIYRGEKKIGRFSSFDVEVVFNSNGGK